MNANSRQLRPENVLRSWEEPNGRRYIQFKWGTIYRVESPRAQRKALGLSGRGWRRHKREARNG